MELRQLRYFVAVAEEGNISRAAQKIFLTQPALSRQIKALEEEIGQCLLERQAHSIRLTPAGETLLGEAKELLRQADQVLERVRAVGLGPRLRVGYAPSLATGMLSVAVANFSQLHPTARVELFDLSTSEMLAGLEAKRLDIVVTVRRQREARELRWIPLVKEPWQLAVGRNHPLASRAQVTANEVGAQPLLIFCQRDYPEYWEQIGAWLRVRRQRPQIAGEYDGAESLMAAVESGLGVAVVTTRMSRLFPGRAKLLALGAGPDPLCIAAGLRSDRSNDKVLGVFVEELRQAAKGITESGGGWRE